jgi:hypothetical protein
MNPAFSDKYLFSKIKEIIKQNKIEKLIETGTWKGYNCDIASKLFHEVHSYEVNYDYYSEALKINKNNKNVKLFLGNSADLFKQNLLPSDYNTMFFLDAHWYDYCPLLDELQEIANFSLKPIIIIHDFYVPNEFGQAKFGFDKFKEQPLNFEYVKEKIENIYGVDNYSLFYIENSEINSGVAIFSEKK